ncbi:hypothetical protein DFP72DRAFT_113420 [Ephemerocybe angulata]|uniref:Uncharacterized protein n=1 Tax=Ephemerocybe angulata TaxID=980116 RepID=A0A8H6LV05_9AGAR|nr:hypothetical protein DFP72DRAFT_113420 [Tulosesus angulatus]
MRGGRKKRGLVKAETACQHCQRLVGNQGLRNHEDNCPERPGPAQQSTTREVHSQDLGREFPQDLRDVAQPGPHRSHVPSSSQEPYDPFEQPPYPIDSTPAIHEIPPIYTPDLDAHQDPEEHLGRPPRLDDIRVEPHPRNAAGKRTRIYAYEDYTTDLPTPKRPRGGQEAPNRSTNAESKPWAPFTTRMDYDFAAMLQAAHLNEPQIKAFIAMANEIRTRPEDFTIVDEVHLKGIWAAASKKHGHGLEEVVVEVQYENEKIQYPLWRIPAWDWCKELLNDPLLKGEFRFDAERLFRHNGKEFERFYNEPWTANDWWRIQGEFPKENAAPFAIILYADKTKLSTMGGKKGYPVYVRCANLPSHIRNGEGLGGGRMIGWLPIVPEDSDKSGKKPFVDFKRVVWHAALYEILASLIPYTESGFSFLCDDDIERWLYPIILILSADFEEQCVMSAIRGMGAKYPCPICLIPADAFPGLDGRQFPARTTSSMKAIYTEANAMETAAEREGLFQSVGLRNVENVFWKLKYSDPYSALSWDRLHAYHSGLFRKHILTEFLTLLEILGRDMSSLFEKQLAAAPRWRDLAHLTHISQFKEYSDGRVYEDLSKIIVFVSHNLFPPSDERGYQWLKIARSYLELDMWSSLRNHTATTVRLGEEELKRFGVEIALYTWKVWNFPKAHSQAHLFFDIINKGVTLNFTTKFFEKMHRVAKIYWNISNYKDIEKLIARLTREELAAMIIGQNIAIYDQEAQERNSATEPADFADVAPAADDRRRPEPSTPAPEPSTPAANTQAPAPNDPPSPPPAPCVVPGSRVQREDILLDDIRLLMANEYAPALGRLRAKLEQRVNHDFKARGAPNIRLPRDIKVAMYQRLTVDYTSVEDSTTVVDILRMNRDFHHRVRYDCALFEIKTGQYIIGRLLTVLGLPAAISQNKRQGEVQYAVVIPFDARVTTDRHPEAILNQKRCSELRMKQIRSRRIQDSVILPVESIVRGALVVQDSGSPFPEDHLVMDVVDPDFFLRMRLQNLGDCLIVDAKLGG